MKLPRVTLATMGFAVLLCAINFAVIRAALFSLGRGFESWSFFAVCLLPLLNALLIVCYRLRLRARRTPGAVGFLMASTVATAVTFGLCCLAPETALDLLRAVLLPPVQAGLAGLTRLVGNAVMQSFGMQLAVGIVVELGLVIAFYSLPPLCVGLLGGWLGRRFAASPWPERLNPAVVGPVLP